MRHLLLACLICDRVREALWLDDLPFPLLNDVRGDWVGGVNDDGFCRALLSFFFFFFVVTMVVDKDDAVKIVLKKRNGQSPSPFLMLAIVYTHNKHIGNVTMRLRPTNEWGMKESVALQIPGRRHSFRVIVPGAGWNISALDWNGTMCGFVHKTYIRSCGEKQKMLLKCSQKMTTVYSLEL